METPVIAQDVYQLQQDTLIVWTEVDGRDLALSFQDARGCSEVWDNICEVQRRIGEEKLRESVAEDVLMSDLSQAPPMPDIELKNLENIEDYVASLCLYGSAEYFLHLILGNDRFLDRILDLFEMAEDLEMEAELKTIFSIVRRIMTLNDAALYKHILKEDVCLRVCGVFEYDPEYSMPKGKHRNYLKSSHLFKKVGEFSNQELEDLIKQTFRAQYLKDVVLVRIIEDPHFNVLNSIIMFNQVEILSSISNDSTFMAMICRDLQDKKSPLDRKKLILGFFHEFCTTARNVQMVDRKSFYSTLASKGVIQELQPFLKNPDYSIRMMSADILAHALDHDAALIRSFIMSQKRLESPTLSEEIIFALINDTDAGMKYHYSEILRILVDWEIDPTADPDNSDFINLFYTEQLRRLVDPFFSLKIGESTLEDSNQEYLELDYSTSCTLQHAVNLMCRLVQLHPIKMRSFLIAENLLSRMMILLKCRQSIIRLLPIRLMRNIVACKDDVLNRHVAKQNLLSEIMILFDQNGSRYNMVDSAILNLLDFIYKSKQTILIKYLAEKFGDVLSRAANYAPVCQNILQIETEIVRKELGEESQEMMNESKSTVVDNAFGRAWGLIDKDEEEYFNSSEDIKEAKNITVARTTISDEPPIPVKRSDDTEEEDFTSRIRRRNLSGSGRSASMPPLGSGSLPSSITVRERRSGETPTNKTDVNAVTPPKLRNITMGSKRTAFDEADPRTWDRLLMTDSGLRLTDGEETMIHDRAQSAKETNAGLKRSVSAHKKLVIPGSPSIPGSTGLSPRLATSVSLFTADHNQQRSPTAYVSKDKELPGKKKPRTDK